jgi:hypothetical protein
MASLSLAKQGVQSGVFVEGDERYSMNADIVAANGVA